MDFTMETIPVRNEIDSAGKYILELSDSNATLVRVGGKGASLARLAARGMPVPGGFYITTAAYRQFVEQNGLDTIIQSALQEIDISRPSSLDHASNQIRGLFVKAKIPADVATAIVNAYAVLPGTNPAVAVRSSATAEDLPDASFAGQQETYLNVSGAAGVLDSTKKCWASLWTARAIGYRARQDISTNGVALAVVVQLLVPAESAGILFTANPITGQRDQVVINAAWGLGEAVVGGSVTPDKIVVSKIDWRIIDRQVADKQLMTVRINGGTKEEPVAENLRRVPVLQDQAAIELAQLSAQIEDLFETPVDIEWAQADGRFYIVQARPITALPEPEAAPPIEWPMPDPKGQYMRTSLVDLLPDPVSPLFATLGIPAAIAGISRAGRYLTHSEPVLGDDYFTTINSYAYMNAGFSPRVWWWLISKLLPAYPRMLRQMVPYWHDKVRPEYKEVIRQWEAKDLDRLSSTELWHAAQEVAGVAMYYASTLMFATMGASAGSEALLTRLYQKFAKSGDEPAAVLLMGYNSIPVQSDKSLYDLAIWSSEQKELADYLNSTESEIIASQLAGDSNFAETGTLPAQWLEFKARFRSHLEKFGYVIYELDFAKPIPRDDPAPILETLKMYMHGKGNNPHERQHASEEKRIETAQSMLNRLKGLRLWAFRKSLNWAQSMAEIREDALADIGLGYPLLRQMLRALGHRINLADAIAQADDIYWLERIEIEAAVHKLDHGEDLEALSEQVKQRKAFWRAAKRVSPPPMLPPKKKFMGFNIDIFLAASEDDQVGDTLQGVAASPGKVTAPARVLHGPEDFDQMQPGAILVAGTTTPAWTPLFAMASGIVTDIGGPLSHGSIVAREYGIPAVMGTGIATKRIISGQTITVDGSSGTVILSSGNKPIED